MCQSRYDKIPKHKKSKCQSQYYKVHKYKRRVSASLSITIIVICRCAGIVLSYGPRREKTCLLEFVNKGADQPAHPRSLISVCVIRFLENIISRLATSEILIL